MPSHSARSAWIETRYDMTGDGFSTSRTPQGVRGLKLINTFFGFPSWLSHSARSAWIETKNLTLHRNTISVALRKECVD